MRRALFLVVLLILIVPRPVATTTNLVCTNGAYVASGDVTLVTGDSVDFVGTATARCLVVMNGHRLIVANATSLTGHILSDYADWFGCGDATHDCISGTNGDGNAAALTSSGYVDIKHSSFHRGRGFNFTTANSATITFSYNTFAADNLVPTTPHDANGQRKWFVEQGSSTADKFMQGNKLYQSWAYLGSPNWTVGASAGCTTFCDRDGNISVGERAGFSMPGTGGYFAYNYTHVRLTTNPDRLFNSQNYNLAFVGAGVVAEHNVLHSGHWVVNQVDGELRDNVITELDPHNLTRQGGTISPDAPGLVHHNIYLTLAPAVPTYNVSTRFSSGDAAIGLFNSGMNLSIYNNTFDARGGAFKTIVWVVSGAQVASYKNNVAYQLSLTDNTSWDVTSAVGVSDSEGYPGLGMEPDRALYLDYNDTYFKSNSPRKVVYAIGVAGKSLGDSGWGGHDVGTLNGQGSDPIFKGPLPIGSGQTGTGCNPCTPATTDSGFPFNDIDILNGTYTVSAMLSYFRWIYAPDTGSPLLSAGSDGAHIGAVASVGSIPSIVTTNKRPMVFAGPSMTVPIADGARLVAYGADDGLPSNILTFAWTKISGPGSVSFADATKALTTATFSAAGVYTLRLAASDGTLTSQQDTQITVTP